MNNKTSNQFFGLKKQTVLLYLLFAAVIFFQLPQVNAQTNTVKADTTKSTEPMSVEDTLVMLALNSPTYKSSANQNKINEYQLKAAKNNWLNLLSLSGNFNNRNNVAVQPAPGGIGLAPAYFFGVNLPIGVLFSRTSVKAAREQIQISNNTQEQLSRNIEADILTKYRRYQNYEQVLILQRQTLDDEETAFLQAKEKFRTGQIPIEQYNTAQKTYTGEFTKKLDLEMQMDLLRIEIERIIGTTLEPILLVKKKTAKPGQ
jgi:outer membrane protein TolC